MNASLEIEVFRSGDYGHKGRYSPEVLERIAGDYDPAVHEAPVTLDHRQDGPAYGWVESLRCAGDVLIARVKDLHESLRDWIRQGAYKKRSIELYRAFARTGRPYLRAVSFLGACPPEVKGLADPVFAEDDGERVIVEFDAGEASDETGETAAFVETDTDADAAMDEPLAREAGAETGSLAREAGAETESLAEGGPETKSPSDTTARLSSELDAERTERRCAELQRFCDEGRREGRILPAWEAGGLISFMLSLGDGEPQIETANGRPVTALEWFQGFLRSLKPQVELGELAADRPSGETRQPALPQPTERASIRPGSLALHERAVAWCEQHEGVTYVEALQAVSRL